MGFTIKTTLMQYAQMAARNAISKTAEFIAPTVPVPHTTGYYKKYDADKQFKLVDPSRSSGGRAKEVGFDADDETYNVKPNGLDFPAEKEAQSQEEFDMQIRAGSDLISQLAALWHENKVVKAALAAAGAGDDVTWDGAGQGDPVDQIDDVILDLLKAVGFGGLMQIRILFGATAWKRFKNATAVRNKFVVSTSKAAGVGYAVPEIGSIAGLFVAQPEAQVTYMVVDGAKEGKDPAKQFILDKNVLIFASMQNPSTMDPSFMKTFRLDGKWMVPGTYQRDDGRVDVAKMDWSEDVQTTNSAAVKRLNVKDAA